MIGNQIAKARKKMNITQSQLAEQLFISAQAVGKWERGESVPDIITMNKLAEILEVDLNYFSEKFNSNENDLDLLDKNIQTEFGDSAKSSKLNWDMSKGNWVDADFSGLKELNSKFGSSNLLRCKFIGSDLAELLLKSNNVDSCDFTDSDLSKCRIMSSNLSKNKFMNCNFKEAEFIKTNLEKCDFSGVAFNGALFEKTFIYACNLNEADLTSVLVKFGGVSGIAGKSVDPEMNTISNAVWNRCSFRDTYFSDLIIKGEFLDCSFENCDFTRVEFNGLTFINTFFKNNEKMKKIKFVACKADRLSYEFLKSSKADMSGIELLD